MFAGIATLARNIPKISKVFSGGKPKTVKVFRAEPYPSKTVKSPLSATDQEKSFGKWFTPDKNYIKTFALSAGDSPDISESSKLIKTIKIPESKLKEWKAKNTYPVDEVGEESIILPKEYSKKAKYNIIESLPYIFNRPKRTGDLYEDTVNTQYYSDWKEILERVRELIALKRAGKKRGGIASL